MRYLSLFSGVEAATLAWEPLGWTPVAFCEFDAFPSSVLAERWPEVPNLGDITKLTERHIKSLGPIDVVVFGSPCQDLSVAGKREGFDGESSSLFRDAIRVIKWAVKHCGVRFALWENVPGAYSSNEGGDFCEVLSSLCGSKLKKPEKWSEAGFCFGKTGLVEWACLDAQYFGVPQRRRRVFALADFGDWTNREPIFSQSESLPGDINPSRQTQEIVAAPIRTSAKAASHWDDPSRPHPTLNQSHKASGGIGLSNQEIFSQRGGCLVPFDMTAFGQYGEGDKGSTCKYRDYKDATDLVVQAFAIRTAQTSSNGWGINDQTAYTLDRVVGQAVAFRAAGQDGFSASEITPPVLSSEGGGVGAPTIMNSESVRRLIPVECERLQGMPDNHTKIPWRNKPTADCPDGLRYKAIGNSMAVPVIRWIGEQIQLELKREQRNAARI